MTTYPLEKDLESTFKVISGATTLDDSFFEAYYSAILAVESELGIKPSGTYSTVRQRLDQMEVSLAGSSNELLIATPGITYGFVVYVSDSGGTAEAVKAIATAQSTSKAVGVTAATMDTVITISSCSVQCVDADVVPGDPLFLSPIVAGAVTKTPPTTAGQCIVLIGECTSTWAAGLCDVVLNIQRPILLSETIV